MGSSSELDQKLEKLADRFASRIATAFEKQLDQKLEKLLDHKGDSLWNAKDVAKYLKVAKSTVYRLANEGTIPSMDLLKGEPQKNGCIRFNQEEVKRWASRQHL